MGRDIPIDSINRYSKYEVGDRILCKDIANTMKEAGISNEDISSVYSKLRGY